MHHSWLYCVGEGVLISLSILAFMGACIGFTILWFTMWEKILDSDDTLGMGLLSILFIVLSVISTLVCKGVIK